MTTESNAVTTRSALPPLPLEGWEQTTECRPSARSGRAIST